MFACGVVPCVKPVAFLNPNLHRDLPIVPITVPEEKHVRVCACVYVCVCVCTPQPPLQTSPPSLSLSHPLSCAHSLILSRAKNWQSCSSVRNSRPQVNPGGQDSVTHSGSFSLQECGGDMEMVHQAIHSLPQYGLSELLSSHKGNYNKGVIWLFWACWWLYVSLYCNTVEAFL